MQSGRAKEGRSEVAPSTERSLATKGGHVRSITPKFVSGGKREKAWVSRAPPRRARGLELVETAPWGRGGGAFPAWSARSPGATGPPRAVGPRRPRIFVGPRRGRPPRPVSAPADSR